jgi:hypothetical protein
MPFWFKIALCGFAFLVVTGFFRRISMPKIKIAAVALPKEKRDKFLQSYSLAVRCYQILLFIFPLASFMASHYFYRSASQHFIYFTAAFIMTYLVILEDFTFRKGIVNEIKAKEGKLTNFA